MKTKKWLWFLSVFILFLYYQIDYKRYFIESSDGSKVFTVWVRYFEYCYIIPGKYYLPYLPKENYIKTDGWKNYLDVVFKPQNKDKYAIAIYQEFKKFNFDKGIRLFKSQKSLEAYYGMDDARISREDKLKSLEYVYVDMDEIYGIRVVRHEELIQTKKNYEKFWKDIKKDNK